MDEILPSVDEI
jgi:peptidoglycan hydrolase CwlO-like protein